MGLTSIWQNFEGCSVLLFIEKLGKEGLVKLTVELINDIRLNFGILQQNKIDLYISKISVTVDLILNTSTFREIKS